MPKANPSQKNQKSPKRSKVGIPLPEEYRARGIGTQKQLIMAMLPYMEWVRYQDLRERFWKIVPHLKNDSPLANRIWLLEKDGYLEKKYEGQPKGHTNDKIKMSGYLYIRRIKRSMEEKPHPARLDGTYGLMAAQNRAKKAKAGPKKPPKTTVKNLTLEDVMYIRQKPMTLQALAEMYGTTFERIHEIQNGRTPQHLKAQLARSRLADNQAGT